MDVELWRMNLYEWVTKWESCEEFKEGVVRSKGSTNQRFAMTKKSKLDSRSWSTLNQLVNTIIFFQMNEEISIAENWVKLILSL